MVRTNAQLSAFSSRKSAQISKLFQLSINPACVADFKGYLIIVNPALCRILGYTEKELLSQPYTSWIHPDDQLASEEALKKLTDGTLGHVSFVNRYQKKDHSYVYFQWDVVAEWENMLLYCNIKDITQQKQEETALSNSLDIIREQNKRLVNFTYIVSHNLRSHVSNLKMLTFLYNSLSDAEERAGLIEKIGQTVEMLDETLIHLNKVVEIQGKEKLERQWLKFEDVLNTVLEPLNPRIVESRAEIVRDFHRCPQVYYVPAYLESILYNLISNAIKYRKPMQKPCIRLCSWKEEGKTILTVADNGLGIDLDRHKEAVFGMYKTFHQNKDAKGLGLFLTANQVESMGGSISVESEVDIGSTFKVIF